MKSSDFHATAQKEQAFWLKHHRRRWYIIAAPYLCRLARLRCWLRDTRYRKRYSLWNVFAGIGDKRQRA
jgi:hypothetical protein